MAEAAEEAAALPPKKPRGRPKDDQAPAKPKNAMQRCHAVERARIKEHQPELCTDLKAMAEALRKVWEDTPQGDKDRVGKIYEQEMEVWKPIWEVYKQTDRYKEFFELKSDWMDSKQKKKLVKVHQRAKVVEGNKVRCGASFVMAYPEEEGTANNYALKVGQRGTVVQANIGGLGHCEIQWDSGEKKVCLKKYLTKMDDPDIPKRPKSGWGIFGGDMRPRAVEEVNKEGGGMGDIGKKIAGWWAELSETKKAEYAERAERQKEVFLKEFDLYRVTDKFKGFENTKVKMDSTQKLKKLARTNLGPKRPPGGFGLWKKLEIPKICAEGKAKGAKLTTGEIGKKLGELWKEVSVSDKAKFEKDATALKAAWEKEQLTHKKNNKYMNFLVQRRQVKVRENRLVNLREQPKKPSSVFALYKKAHKSEVPQGKGEGKGSSALKKKFEQASEDEKARLANIVKEADEKWKAELDEFKTGDQFKLFKKTEDKVTKEFMTEAMKVMTLKFLNAAPAQPPKTGFSVYIGEKRKADGVDDEAAPKSKEAKQEEVKKYKTTWDKLTKPVQKEYDGRRKEKLTSWKEEIKAFMAQEHWQEYIKEARRLKIPVQQLLQDKKATLKKLKNGMRLVTLPSKPESMPVRPPDAYKLFVREKKKETSELEKIDEMWKQLDEAGKKPYLDEEKTLKEQFLSDMKEFKDSDEGKVYLRSQKGALRLRVSVKAKFTYLKDMPKKPDGALKVFIDKKFKEGKAAHAALKPFEVKEKIKQQWLAMSDEEKASHEAEAKQKLDEYNTKMEEFKASDNWKNYNKAVKPKTKTKKRVVSKVPRAPKAPQELPTEPPSALEAFAKQEGNGGLDAEALKAAFGQLEPEAREALEAEAKKAEESHKEEMNEFNKTEKGQTYRKEVADYERKKRTLDLKAKAAKAAASAPKKPAGHPEKPMSAFKLYMKGQIGQGKDLATMNRGYAELSAEERAKFEAEAKEADEKYQAELAEFNKTEAGKKYQRSLVSFDKRKKLGDAKAKYLGDAPSKPDNALTLFSREKRAEVAKDSSIKGIGGVTRKVYEMFKELSAEEKEVWQEKEREANKEYEEKLKEFQNSALFKRYKAVEQKMSGKSGGGGAKAKAKSALPPAPDVPPGMPKKPPMSFFLFKMENKGNPKEVHSTWMNLGAPGQEEWNKKYKDKVVEYEKEMKEFMKTADGKKYTRLKVAFDKKVAEKKAKDKYLGGDSVPKEPKRPQSAYFLFVSVKRPSVVEELGTAKFAEVSAAVTKKWNDADADEKKVFEEKAKAAKEEYDQAMKEYRSSDAVKRYDRAMNTLKKKPKGKPKAKANVKVAATRGAPKAKAGAAAKAASDSDSDVMGSDSSNSSSSDSDSD